MANLQQVTSSYRSGREAVVAGSQEMRLEDALLSGGKGGNTLGKLRTEEKHYPSHRGDNGHPFSTEKRWIECPDRRSITRTASGITYRGDNFVRVRRGSSKWAASEIWPVVPSWDSSYYGTLAIKSTKPDNPAVGLAVALAELRREGLPHLSGSQLVQKDADRIRKLGGEYLNIEFGWKPIVSDIIDTMHMVDKAQAIIKQYARDSGRVVRRRMSFPEIVSEVTLPEATGYGLFDNTDVDPWFGNTYSLSPAGKQNQTTVTKQNIWFSGAYTYYLPKNDGIAGKLDRYSALADKLLGLQVTPEVLWNLAPWSWLSDWHFNVGHILSNLESFKTDGILLRYGYLMRHTTVSRTCTLKGPRLRVDPVGTTYTNRLFIERKERRRADPFGFSLNPNQYSDRQWAILGALGLSKAPKAIF